MEILHRKYLSQLVSNELNWISHNLGKNWGLIWHDIRLMGRSSLVRLLVLPHVESVGNTFLIAH